MKSISIRRLPVIFKPKRLILFTICQIVEQKSSLKVSILILLLLLQLCRALVCLVWPLSHHQRVIMFDYFYLNNLPNQLNAVEVGALLLTIYFYYKLFYVEFRNDYVLLVYKVLIVDRGGEYSFIRRRFKDKLAIELVRKVTDWIIWAHAGFYPIICKCNHHFACESI